MKIMQDEQVQRIRAAARSVESPKVALLEALADFARTSSAAETDLGPVSWGGGPVGQGLSRGPGSARQHVIAISVEDLAELLEVVARPETFAEALIAEGFQPASGPQPALRRGNRRNPLKRP